MEKIAAELYKFRERYLLSVSDYIFEVYKIDKGVYNDILDELYWELFINPKYNTESSRMVKLFSEEQIQSLNSKISSSINQDNKQQIKNIIINTDQYKTFVDKILPVDDDVCDEMGELRNKWVYKPLKKLDKRPYPHSVINKQDMLLAFYHAWLDTEYVSEKSKQREYLAKLGIDKLNEDWFQSHVIEYENENNTNMFTDAVLEFRDKNHGRYAKLANIINKRDYKKQEEII